MLIQLFMTSVTIKCCLITGITSDNGAVANYDQTDDQILIIGILLYKAWPSTRIISHFMTIRTLLFKRMNFIL